MTVSKDTVTFRLTPEKRTALDEIAEGIDRVWRCHASGKRTYVLNEAIDLYLELHRWQVAHILDGIQQADAEEFATDDEVKAAFDRWRQ